MSIIFCWRRANFKRSQVSNRLMVSVPKCGMDLLVVRLRPFVQSDLAYERGSQHFGDEPLTSSRVMPYTKVSRDCPSAWPPRGGPMPGQGDLSAPRDGCIPAALMPAKELADALASDHGGLPCWPKGRIVRNACGPHGRSAQCQDRFRRVASITCGLQ